MVGADVRQSSLLRGGFAQKVKQGPGLDGLGQEVKIFTLSASIFQQSRSGCVAGEEHKAAAQDFQIAFFS